MYAPYLKSSEPGCSMGTAIRNFFKHYATFNGRSSRSEYWLWALFNFILIFPFSLVYIIAAANMSHYHYDEYGSPHYSYTDEGAMAVAVICGIVIGIWNLATLIPGLSLFARRMHDIGRSGWWYFIAFVPVIGGIILLFFCCTDSEHYVNEYGGVAGRKYPNKPNPYDPGSYTKNSYNQGTHNPGPPQQAPCQQASGNADIATELEKYGKLLQQGLINQEEYAQLKRRLLNI